MYVLVPLCSSGHGGASECGSGCTLFVLISVVLGDVVPQKEDFNSTELVLQLPRLPPEGDQPLYQAKNLRERIKSSEHYKSIRSTSGINILSFMRTKKKDVKSQRAHTSVIVSWRPCLDSRSGNRLMVCRLLLRPFARQPGEREIDAHQD